MIVNATMFLYPEDLSKIRQMEFLQLKDSVYLDHAGSTVYSNSQIAQYTQDLQKNLYGNPHSANPSSNFTSDTIHQVRFMILSHFNTSPDKYDVIFTDGATDAAKILSSTFSWEPGVSKFAYLEDNHTSIVGIREIAAANNSNTFCLCLKKTGGDLDPYSLSSYCPTVINSSSDQFNSEAVSEYNNLFAYSAQSNFSGCKYPLDWTTQVKNSGIPYLTESCDVAPEHSRAKWAVLLDAASFAATSSLDLHKHSPDFVCLSFYKLFGFPTGIGALLVKQTSSNLLCNKVYFGGGTVDGYIAKEKFHKPRQLLHARLEDGTLPFLDIVALKHGFDFIHKAIDKTMIKVQLHTFTLAQKLFAELSELKHENGNPVVEIYSYSNFTDTSKQGPIVTFNLKRADCSYVGFNHVLHLASSCNIHLRGGCFCNVGGCMAMVGIPPHVLKTAYESGYTCGGALDLLNGKPLGAVRASLGYMSTKEDVKALVQFLKKCFVDADVDEEIYYDASPYTSQLYLKDIYLYPVKSCRGMKVSEWPISETGLKYDRSWMIVNEYGVGLTLKRERKLALIQPHIDLEKMTLTLSSNGFHPITIPVDLQRDISASTSMDSCHTKVCGDRVTACDCGEEVAAWLSGVLEKTARLMFKPMELKRVKTAQNNHKATSALALTNEAQYLLLSLSSVRYLHEAMMKNNEDTSGVIDIDAVIKRFRCNFVIAGALPFAEEKWSEIIVQSKKAGDLRFNCTDLCNRCSMVCVDSETGEKDVEPLRTLGSLQAPNDTKSLRRTTFGVYLKSNCSDFSVAVGDSLLAVEK